MLFIFIWISTPTALPLTLWRYTISVSRYSRSSRSLFGFEVATRFFRRFGASSPTFCWQLADLTAAWFFYAITGHQAIRPWMEGAFQAPTSFTVNTAFGSTTASPTPLISAVRTRTAQPDGMDWNDNMIMETDTTMLQTTTPWTRISEPGEELSHSSCFQESVTSRTSSSSAPRVSSLPPSANPSSH